MIVTTRLLLEVATVLKGNNFCIGGMTSFGINSSSPERPKGDWKRPIRIANVPDPHIMRVNRHRLCNPLLPLRFDACDDVFRL